MLHDSIDALFQYASMSKSQQTSFRATHAAVDYRPSSDWLNRAMRAFLTRMTAIRVDSSHSTDHVDDDVLSLLALLAPRALVDSLILQAAINPIKHSSIIDALLQVDDILLADRRIAPALARVLAAECNATFLAVPVARDSLVRFIRRLLDADPTSADARPVVAGAVFEFVDDDAESLFPTVDSLHVAQQPLLSWSEFVTEVAMPVIVDTNAFRSAAADVVFGVFLRNGSLNNRIVSDVDVFVRVTVAVGKSLFDARSAGVTSELERRVHMFNELLKLQAVRRTLSDDDLLTGEALLRLSRSVSPHPHSAHQLIADAVSDSQACVLAAICAGSNACTRLAQVPVVADVTALLDAMCATDFRTIETLFGPTVLPDALHAWLMQQRTEDDCLERCMYVLNAWLRSPSATTRDACRVLVAVARFPPSQRARRDCIAQLVVAIAERLQATPDFSDAVDQVAVRAALDETQLATIDAARSRHNRN
jgi:hypothetical protein